MIRSHFVLVIAATVVLTGCGEDKKAQAPATLTIAIGSVAPLTGGIAHLGKDNENGARLAVEEANAAKIRIGGKEAVFQLLAEDDQEDAKVGNTVAQKLVDAKVAGVVGHLNSGTSIPASNIYSGANIPMITGSATNPELTERGLKGVFRVVGRDDQQGPAVANYLIANAKPKVVAIIDDATAYGKGLANEVEKTLKAAGVNVLAREQGTNKTVDWKAVLTKLKGRSPDAVFSFGDGACTDKMGEFAGSAADGLLCSQAGIPPQAASKKFLDAYKKRFNIDPILYAPFTYDAANLLIDAMKQANSADAARYLPVLQKIDFAGATGRISFDEKGDRKDAEMTIFTMKGGKLLPIAIIKSGKTIKYEDFVAQSTAPAADVAKK